jgi:hypothetical protein
VHVLVAFIDAAYHLVGTSFVVESVSERLLLAAYHCLAPNARHFGLVRSATRNEDGTGYMDPPQPIRVELVGAETVSDVAILRAECVLPAPFLSVPPLSTPLN